MRRTTVAIATAAALSAAAVLSVLAAGYAIYALTAPIVGAPWAAGIVSLAAAVTALVLVRAFAGLTEVEEPSRVEIAQAIEMPSSTNAPLTLVAAAFRERPVMALGLTVVAGVIAAQRPQIVRELAGALSDRR